MKNTILRFHLSCLDPTFESELNSYCKFCTVKNACVKLPIGVDIQTRHIKKHGFKKEPRLVCINCAYALVENNVYKIEFGRLAFN